jgi:hypothetical protein
MNIAIKGGFARSCKLQVRRAGRLRISHAIGASAFAPAPCRERRFTGGIRGRRAATSAERAFRVNLTLHRATSGWVIQSAS